MTLKTLQTPCILHDDVFYFFIYLRKKRIFYSKKYQKKNGFAWENPKTSIFCTRYNFLAWHVIMQSRFWRSKKHIGFSLR